MPISQYGVSSSGSSTGTTTERSSQARVTTNASGRADAHFELDAQAGELTFGDGEHGRALPDGAELYVTSLHTRAAAGLYKHPRRRQSEDHYCMGHG